MLFRQAQKTGLKSALRCQEDSGGTGVVGNMEGRGNHLLDSIMGLGEGRIGRGKVVEIKGGKKKSTVQVSRFYLSLFINENQSAKKKNQKGLPKRERKAKGGNKRMRPVKHEKPLDPLGGKGQKIKRSKSVLKGMAFKRL